MKVKANLPFPNETQPYVRLGTVNACIDGKAQSITAANVVYKVYVQASHLPALRPGDEILFFFTEKGVYVLARNLRAGESPLINWQQSDDKLSLKFGEACVTIFSSGEILIRNPHANLVLNADGTIELQGKNIQQNSASDIQLMAQNIYLNDEE